MGKRPLITVVAVSMFALFSIAPGAEGLPGESPALGDARMQQDQIADGELDLEQIRREGLRLFTTLFNSLDGHGDGPTDPVDPTTPGGRPTLQGNGTLLRVNGLDAQGCIECHAFVSTTTTPPTLGIGGVGGANTNAIIMPTLIDVADEDLDGAAGFNGRFANPPFVFGAGAVELLALEMTTDLQALRDDALAAPGTVVELLTKGVTFGSIVADAGGNLDTSQVEGVDHDLVVRPFGRKGEFPSIREFDLEAMQFHFGMQPMEVAGQGVDADGDGVYDEVVPGEISALSVFIATLDRPRAEPLDAQAEQGRTRFEELGCAACHVPALTTRQAVLPMRFPEVATDADANVFYDLDLSAPPTEFATTPDGGLFVPLLADLKRHDMGPDLAESFAAVDEQANREFTTARLWGVADTAPYLHDGRATTLSEAILLHGGEAEQARDAFDALDDDGRRELLAFLRSQRTPEAPLADLLGSDDEDDGADDEDDGANGGDAEGDDGEQGGGHADPEIVVTSGEDGSLNLLRKRR